MLYVIQFPGREVIFEDGVNLLGEVLGLDLRNVITNSDYEQEISDQKWFRNGVTIEGYLNINGSINGVNYTEFCLYGMGLKESKLLVVNGTHKAIKKCK